MKFKAFILVFGLLSLVAYSCQRAKDTGIKPQYPFSGADTAQVDVVLAGMSLDEKIGQLILWEAPMEDTLCQELVYQKARDGLVGGVLLSHLNVAEYLYAADSMRRSARLPLFFATNQKVALHNQFVGVPRFPAPVSMATIDSAQIQNYLEEKFVTDCKALGVNLALNLTVKTDDTTAQPFDYQTFESDERVLDKRFDSMFERLKDNRILGVADHFSNIDLDGSDSLRRLSLRRFSAKVNAGLAGMLLGNQAFGLDTVKSLLPNYPRIYLNKYLGFKGLTMVQLAAGESPDRKILAGAELFLTTDADNVFNTFHRLLDYGKLNEMELNHRVRRVLLAKSWVHGGKLPVKLSIVPHDSITNQPVKFVSISEKRAPEVIRKYIPKPANLDARIDKTVCYFEDPRWDYFIGKLFEHSVVLARDQNDNLPFKAIYNTDYQLFSYSRQPFRDFGAVFGKYANFKVFAENVSASGELKPVVFGKTDKQPTAIILLDNLDLQPGFHKQFIESVNELANQSQAVVVNFGNPKNLRLFAGPVTCVQVFEKNQFTESYAAQLLFGGVMSEGRLPVTVDETMTFGASVRHKPVRLGFGEPRDVGIADERLVGINAIVESAIDNGVFPGCQIAIAKDGEVIFSKSFGHFTYNKTAPPVRNTDLYDIASMTKVAATTLVAMSLVQTNQLDLNGKVADYLKVPAGSAVGNIKIRQLLLHQSGLQAQMPLARFFSGKNVPIKGCNDYFCRKRKGEYRVKVAENLFFNQHFRDTILKRVLNLPVMAKPKFRYSDVNFFLLKKILEARSNTSLDRYVAENIYRPLGLRSTTYNPLEKFPLSRIVPTEQDNYWRKTLVQGYVHDPGVALLGGVGGSAGIFSTAEDLAVLFQMLLNEGAYGGYDFFDKQTVEDFVTNKYTNHRGLGFDKPTKRRYPTYASFASAKTYGHTGFTGTCVWVDPSQRLVYIFLSNRVNPSSRNGKIFTENVRSRIHEVVYKAFGSFDNSLPTLEVEEEIEVEEGAGG